MKSVLLAVALSTLVALTAAAPTLVVKQEGDKWTWALSATQYADPKTKAKTLWEYKLQSNPFSDKQSCIRSATALFVTYGNPNHCKKLTGAAGGDKPADPAKGQAPPVEQQPAFDASQIAAGRDKVSCVEPKLRKALDQVIGEVSSNQQADEALAGKAGFKLSTSKDAKHPFMELTTQTGQRILRSPDNLSVAGAAHNTWCTWLLVGAATSSYKIVKGDDGKWSVKLEAMSVSNNQVTAKAGSLDSYDSEEEAKKALAETVKQMRKLVHVVVSGEAPSNVEQQKQKKEQAPKKEQQPGKKAEQPKKEQQTPNKNKEQQPKKEQPAKKEQQPAKKQNQLDDNDVSEDDAEDDSDDDDEADF